MRAFNPELAIPSDTTTVWDAFAATPTLPSTRSGTPSPVVAQLGPAHESQFLDLLLGLDNESRAARFGHALGEASLIAYGKGALSTAAFIAGVFVDGTLRGVVDVFDGNGVYKIAFAVHQDWRRRGFGLALLTAAREWAQQSGVTTLRLVMSRSNWPTRNLAQKMGARFDLSLDEIRADIPVAKRHCSLAAAHLEEIYT
jgi:GNAT superfamily N-acetyltransferase